MSLSPNVRREEEAREASRAGEVVVDDRVPRGERGEHDFVGQLHALGAAAERDLLARRHATALLLVVEANLSLQLADEAQEDERDRGVEARVHHVGWQAREVLPPVDRGQDVPSLDAGRGRLAVLGDGHDHDLPVAGTAASKQKVLLRDLALQVDDHPACGACLLLPYVPLALLRVLRIRILGGRRLGLKAAVARGPPPSGASASG
mmetsp:Transcript_109383/g.235597  ORF Transcript_109383/g.235597 Transcript_109383/m.235597 type:complete len:206 (+) Transcript_109383:279-896(+)